MSGNSGRPSSSLEWTTFSGNDGDNVTVFIQSVKRVAFAQNKQRDEEWILDYVETCLTDTAMTWFLRLDHNTAKSWSRLQHALIQRFSPSASNVSRPTAVPAAAPPPSISSSSGIVSIPPLPRTIPNQDNVNVTKSLFLGDSGVGKSCLFSRITCSGWVRDAKPTTGVDYEVHTRNPSAQDQGRSYPQFFHIWDASGNPGDRTRIKQYIPGVDITYLIYDITNESSFSSIPAWLSLIQQCGGIDTSLPASLCLVGNKLDLASRRQVSQARAEALARELKIRFLGEVSAKTNVNIEWMSLGDTEHKCVIM